MKTWQHLKVLIWKNFILWRRSWIVSLIEIFIPVVMVAILILIRMAVDKKTIAATSYVANLNDYSMNSTKNFVQGTNIKNCKGTPVGLVPNNSITQGLAAKLAASGMATRYFNSEKELDDHLTNIFYDTPAFPVICFAVMVFEPSAGNYEMHLRYNTSNRQNYDVYNTRFQLIDPIRTQMTDEAEKVFDSGFSGVANALSAEIYKKESGGAKAEMYVRMNSVFNDVHYTDELANILRIYLEVFIVLPFVLPFLRMVSKVLFEKEKKLREGMKMMGMSNSSFYLSWIIHYMIVYLIITILMTIFLQVSVFPKSEGFFIWLLLYFFTLNLIMQALFITVFFSRAKLGVLVALVFFFVLYFIKQIAAGSEDKIAPRSTQLAASLSPHAALGLAGVTIMAMEGQETGLSTENMSLYINNYNVSNAFSMLFVSLVIFTVLFLYLDLVFPNEFGKKKHPLFFLPFLIKKKNGSNEPKDDESLPTNPDSNNDICEGVDENLKALEGQGEVLEIKNLCKKYPNGKLAVRNLSLTMYKNQIFALLGHNGAGKSTTISMLTGLLEISSGFATAFGKDVNWEMDDIRKFLGVCPQHDILFDDLTVKEHLELFATFKGMEKIQREGEVHKMIRDIDLVDKTNARTKTLSGGQKRRLSVGIALIGDSKLVLLDEPTSGMDTSARRHIWEMLKNYKQNRIIILTTHFMDEADFLGDRIAIMGEGILKCCGSSVFLKNKFGVGYNLTIVKKSQEANEELINTVQTAIPEAKFISEISAEIAYQLPMESIDKFKALFDELDSRKDQLNIQTYGISITTLEEVFLRVAEGIDPNEHQVRKKEEASPDEEPEYDLASIRITAKGQLFMIHFWAIMVKRMKYFIRDTRGLFFEVFIPFIVIIIGLGIIKSQTRDVPVSRKLAPESFLNPLNIYYGNVSTVNPNAIIAKMDTAMTMIYNNASSINLFDDHLKEEKSRTQLGGYFIQYTAANTIEYDVLYNTIAPTFGPLMIVKMNEAFISASTNKNVKITLFNNPMPLTDQQKKVENSIDSTQFVIIFGIGMAFLPASIIVFIVKERQYNVKHQHLISGVSLFAYWISNFIVDLLKYVITAILCALMILAFNAELFSKSAVYGEVWGLFLLFGPAIISFTYCMSFLFKEYSSAQLITFFANYFLGSLFAVINGVLFFIPNTRGFAKNFPYLWNIFPSFAFLHGLVLVGTRDFYAQIERTFIPKDAIHMDVAGKSIVYLGVTSIVFFILIFVIEMIIEKRGALVVRANEENSSSRVFDSDVKAEIEKIEGDSPENYTVRVNKTRKVYKGGKVAVDLMSFGIKNGECFGLLGVNGAGKTTSFKMMTGDIIPSAGEIHIMGYNVITNMNKAREFIGYCPQFDSLLDNLTCKEHLMLYGALKGIPMQQRIAMVNSKIREMQLSKFENVQSGTLSGGNKRKLSVAIATLGNPPIIFLDEPSTGMDPEARRFMWTIISRISTLRKKSSVVLTTHAMEEAEALCSRMGIMVEGKFVCLGSIQHIKQKYGSGYEVEVKLKSITMEEIDEKLGASGLVRDQSLDREGVSNALNLMGADHLIPEIRFNGSGSSIYFDSGKLTGTKIEVVAEYVLTEERGSRVMDFVGKNIGQFTIIEHFQAFYRFKITAEIQIGKLFGEFQEHKEDLSIAQYSIRQATIEQIFNAFATKQINTAQFIRQSTIMQEDQMKALELHKNEEVEMIPLNKEANK